MAEPLASEGVGEPRVEAGETAGARLGQRIGASVAGKAAGLLAKVAALAICGFATAFAIFMTVPESNDYIASSLLKHDRLEALGSPKIVLVGGSNLAFGVDSGMIQRQTGCPVVNMGMNGYFGVRMMLEEVKPQIQRDDIVVIAFEYDNFFKSVDGSPGTLLVLMKANPSLIQHLTLKQKLDVLTQIPHVAQQKIMRLVEERIEGARDALLGDENSGAVNIREIESLSGFTPEGDLVSHLGVNWPYAMEREIMEGPQQIEGATLALMRDFTEDVKARGGNVMISYTPLRRRAYADHRETLDALHERINSMPPMQAPSPPSRFVFDRTRFFDTVYHLDAEGRALRTQRLIEDLNLRFGDRAHCDGGQVAQH